ncbi:MAG: YtxH domain-containing protein [Syntrophomonadaceae bacterium]|nr:YtxH domain-containing protein [Syntrophomonadaceae bacterium]
MRRSFWNGLLAGSLLGAAITWFMTPQTKPGTVRRIMGRSRNVGSRARRMLRQMGEGISDFMER